MRVTWDLVKSRAVKFSKDWVGAISERADKQTFWNEFFLVFGLERRHLAVFEEPVKTLRGTYGAIDLFWPGLLLVEHKGASGDLEAAKSQAFQYMADLASSGRADETPRFVILSNFKHFVLFDLDTPEQEGSKRLGSIGYLPREIPLADLHKNVHLFSFLRGEKRPRLDPEDPANEKAYRLMCNLHDQLKADGFSGKELERLLVRILFCLFADDNGIFEPNTFRTFLRDSTKEDGSDLSPRLNELFETLNTRADKRPTALGGSLVTLPYVNGALFSERLGFPVFTEGMRAALIECSGFQWAKISPAVFGSLFQGVLLPSERRQQGAHYTSEKDILKVVRSLFLDDLRGEFERLCVETTRTRKAQLQKFHEKLRKIRLLDPACGCGNFLMIAYRELRTLELDVIAELNPKGQMVLDINAEIKVNVDQLFGIEAGEWPCRIAEVSIWLTDHQLNQEASERLGQYFIRLPLTQTPKIHCANALEKAWEEILPPGDSVYVLGNPPFVGKKEQSKQQKADIKRVWGETGGIGVLDYVACWYRKAATYIKGHRIVCAFVSTNSITQGQQAGVLWGSMFREGIKIHFAHRTFAWESEARGKAHVHVVIVGFAAFDRPDKRLFEYGSRN